MSTETARFAPLVVFDFDWSLINENSDTFVFDKLCPELAGELRELSRTSYKDQWTKLMDHLVGRMMCEPYNISIEDINKALCEIPVFNETLEALKYAHSVGCTVCILSDANEHYIDIILAQHGILDLITYIATNKTSISSPSASDCINSCYCRDSRRLHIYPYQPENDSHKCSLCPQNLCKGNVLDIWKESTPYSFIVYIGDGAEDFCPVTRLGEKDVVLCRANWPLHKNISDCREGRVTQAKVAPWESGAELFTEFLLMLPVR